MNLILAVSGLLPGLLMVSVLPLVAQAPTPLIPAAVEPYTRLTSLVLAGLTVFTLDLNRRLPHQRVAFAWKASLRMLGWVGAAASLGVITLLLASPVSVMPWSDKTRVVEFIVPLALAVQAALIFSPDDEPALEVLLVCPRPIAWVLLERLAVLFLVQAAIALIGVVLTTQFTHDVDFPALLLRWLPPALMLTGIAVYVTQRARVAALGVISAGLIWFGAVFLGDVLLPGMPTISPLDIIQPFLWVVHPFLEPGILSTADYWLNRFSITLLGLYLILSVLVRLEDEEYILLGTPKPSANHQGQS